MERCGSRGRRRVSDGGADPAGSACASECCCGDSSGGSTRTSPERSATTLSKAATATVSHPHEVSKRHVRIASWRAERIGPTIIAVPHRDTPTSCTSPLRWSPTRSRAWMWPSPLVWRAGSGRAPRGPRDRCSRESPTAGCARSYAAVCVGRSAAATPSPTASSFAARRRGRNPSSETSRAHRRRRASGDC